MCLNLLHIQFSSLKSGLPGFQENPSTLLYPVPELCVGKNKSHTSPCTPFTPLKLGICTLYNLSADRPVGHIIVGGGYAHALKRHPYSIHRCQNQFIIPFSHRVWRFGRKFNFSLNSRDSRIPPACLDASCVILAAFLHVAFTCWIQSLDWKHSVLLPLKYKTESQESMKVFIK